MNNSLFFHKKPVFGLDIGFNSMKVMQLSHHEKQKHRVIGYGATQFAPESIKEGVIVKPEAIAIKLQELFSKNLIGEINTNRCALAVPASRTFNRSLTLPRMAKKDLDEAIKLEAEQYIPIPTNELYLDYITIGQTDTETELLMVASSNKIIDSYITLCDIAGLEPTAIETTISAGGRLFLHAEESDYPTVLLDLGSISSDITIFDNTLIVTSTVAGGGDDITRLIGEKLGVSTEEAQLIKTKYGLGVSKKQKEITEALKPLMDRMIKEIKRMIRYYEERSDKDERITQVVTLGGGANMPGFSEYLTNVLRLPTRMCDPWQNLKFADLQPPNSVEKPMYITVAGLALLNSSEVYK